MFNLRRFLIGRRLASDEVHHTHISNPVALAVFSSDALSSVAYATQEIMVPLSAAAAMFGHGVIGFSWWVALGIVLLLVLLKFSYSQTIHAYPGGGGAYLVAKDNLGQLAAQVAGASLLTDYILTVAVSTSAGVSALVSAFPTMDPHRVLMALAVIAFVGLMNLRGVKESGAVFSIPTYGFIICIVLTLLTGFFKLITGKVPPVEHVEAQVQMTTMAAIWLFMKAYSAGCTALTGVEAISDGVTAFRAPCADNASKTMTWMVILLGSMFLGITYLANHYGIVYTHGETQTLLSKLISGILGGVRTADGFAAPTGYTYGLYVIVQGFTMLILLLAANTAYADFPRLAAIMARDGYLPQQFTSQGDRLVFSNGIVILSLSAGVLVAVFNAKEDFLLPLYALGVFLGFTLSQTSMVVRWFRLKGVHWQMKAFWNGLGAVATAIVTVDIAITKFTHGAWVVAFIIPVLVLVFFSIHRYYVGLKAKLAMSRAEAVVPQYHHAVVLVSSHLHKGVIQALGYARLIAGERVEALTVDIGSDGFHDSPTVEKLRADWLHYGMGVPLRSLPSPFRKIVEPVLEEIKLMRLVEPERTITVVLPEFVTSKWWQRALHNQTAWRIKAGLLELPNVIVISVPMHLT